MKMSTIPLCIVLSFLFSCSSQNNACEDVILASEQIQDCQALQRKITQASNQPFLRTELERRYQKDCINTRYYRDEHQQAVCGNKENINAIKNSVIEERDQ